MPNRCIRFSEEDIAELRAEAIRQQRTVSELVRQAWVLAKDRLHRLPTPRGAEQRRMKPIERRRQKLSRWL